MDLYINLNFTIFLKVFLMGLRGPQGLIKISPGGPGINWGAEFFEKSILKTLGAEFFENSFLEISLGDPCIGHPWIKNS